MIVKPYIYKEYKTVPQLMTYLSTAKNELSSADEVEEDQVLKNAIDLYRKLTKHDGITKEEQSAIEERIHAMETREIVERSEAHTPTEVISEDDKVLIGPPTLTRFEKARIMGARALQLSLGAPPFVEIPAGTKTSLVIAMSELEQRVIPIVIRRVLPNGDFQNIPIGNFE